MFGDDQNITIEGLDYTDTTADRLFTVPPVLTARQQLVYDLTEHGPVSPEQAGIAWHVAREQGCENCKNSRPCEWADTTGRDALEWLRTHGLLKRDRHHVYRRADEAAGLQGDLPADY